MLLVFYVSDHQRSVSVIFNQVLGGVKRVENPLIDIERLSDAQADSLCYGLPAIRSVQALV